MHIFIRFLSISALLMSGNQIEDSPDLVLEVSFVQKFFFFSYFFLLYSSTQNSLRVDLVAMAISKRAKMLRIGILWKPCL